MPTPDGLMDGRAELARRITELDEDPWRPPERDDLDQFIKVMERITSAGAEPDFHTLPRATPGEADAAVGSSRLLARLEEAMPEIVTGPVRLDAQYWLGYGPSYEYRTRRNTLDQAHFVGVLDAPELEPSSKPFHVGLYTCTGVLGTFGMWRRHLDRYRGIQFGTGLDLHALPWHTWAVTPSPDARVLPGRRDRSARSGAEGRGGRARAAGRPSTKGAPPRRGRAMSTATPRRRRRRGPSPPRTASDSRPRAGAGTG